MNTNPMSCRELIAAMPAVFNPQVAGNLTGDIYFHITGSEPGDYTLHIADGKCTFNEGKSAAPKITIEAPSEVWTAISTGKMDATEAFMTGKFRATGDFSLLMKMPAMFKAG